MEFTIKKYHETLAEYFFFQPHFFDGGQQKKPHIRKCMELPFQQTKAQLWEEVTNTLCNLDFIQAKAASKMTFDLIEDFNAVLQEIPVNKETIREENVRQSRMHKYACDLIAYARAEITELEIPESFTPWSEERINEEIERIKTSPTLLDQLREFLNFLGQEADNLHRYAYEFQNFTTQQAWNYADSGPVDKVAQRLLKGKSDHFLMLNQYTRPGWNPLPQTLRIMDGSDVFIKSVCLTFDCTLAVSSHDKTIILWALKTGKVLRILKGHTDSVQTISLSPNGKRALSGSNDKTLILWDLESGQIIRTLTGHTRGVVLTSILPDGNHALSSSGDKLLLWDLESGQILKYLKEDSKRTFYVKVFQDGKSVLCSYDDSTITILSTETGQVLRNIEGKKGSVIMCVTPDGNILTKSGIHDLSLCDLETGTVIKTLVGHKDSIKAVRITPDGKLALTGSDDKTLILWNLETGQAIRTLTGHTDMIFAVDMTPDGSRAVSGSRDKTMILWDLEKGQKLRTIEGHVDKIRSVSITSCGKRALTVSMDRSMRLWDIETCKTLKLFNYQANNFAASLTNDNNHAVSGSSDKAMIFWDLNYGRALKTLKGHTELIRTVSVLPNGKYAVSGAGDNTLILWNLEKGQSVRTFYGHTSLGGTVNTSGATPDGKCAISGSGDHTLILWDLETGNPHRIMRGHKSYVTSVCVSPDGKHAVSGSMDKSVILWDLKTGQAIRTIKGHTDSVNAVSISPDCSRIVSGSDDKAIILWELETCDKLAWYPSKAYFCSLAFFPGGLFCGMGTGEIFILNASREILCPGPAVITIRYIWLFDEHKYLGPIADCPFCGNRFGPPVSVLETIETILKKCRLKPEQSPCLELPDDVWKDPDLLGECPECRGKLKFNPFVVRGELV